MGVPAPRAWDSLARAALVAVVAAGCVPSAWPDPPALVRDDADIFTAGAEFAADTRLRQIARDHGAWIFVLTHPRPDPPRVLEGPMGEADDAGVQAVAFVLQRDGLDSTGRNEAAQDLFDVLTQAGIETSFSVAALEPGRADKALGTFVTKVEGILNGR